MGKKSNVLTREQREAIELLNKLTNKALHELSGFWNANQNQFKQNKVVLKEALKKAIREDRNGNKEEMFNFFWSKLGEVKSTQNGKKNQKGLEINEDFINEMVINATLSGNYRYIENLGEKIGYEKLINNGRTYRIMLEAGRIDMFKQLYGKAYQLYHDKKGNMSIKTIATGIAAATEKNSKEALDFCIEIEKENPDSKLLGVWKDNIKTLIQKGDIERAEERLNAIEKQAGIMDNSTYKEIMKVAVVNNANAIFDYCLNGITDKERVDYDGIFMLAVVNDNAHVIGEIGKEVSNDVLKGSLAAKIVKRESLKDIEKQGEDGNIIKDRTQTKENMIKSIGDYIISQDKSQINDAKTIQEKGEEFFNKLEKEADVTINLISDILINNNKKNREYVNDVMSNLLLAKYHAENITIGDRVVAETEKIAERQTKFRKESKQIVQEISTINTIVTMQHGKGNSFKGLLGLPEGLSKRAMKLIAVSGGTIIKEIKSFGSRLRKKTNKFISKDIKNLEVQKPDTIKTAPIIQVVEQTANKEKNTTKRFSSEQIRARRDSGFVSINSEDDFEELTKAVSNKTNNNTQPKINIENRIEKPKSNEGPKLTI